MFYKIKKIISICFCTNFLVFNAYSQELELFSEDTLIAPPQKEDLSSNDENNIEKKLQDSKILAPINMPEKKGLTPKTGGESPLGITPPKEPIKNTPSVNKSKKKNTSSNSDAETEKLLKEYNSSFDDSVFTEMSEIEKESALLTLRLKKEQIKNDLEAIKQKRIDAENQEKEKKEALLEKKRDEDREKQKELLKEQQNLKDKEIAFEKLRQEELLNDYKEAMLKEKQELLKSKAELYVQLKDAKEETSNILQSTKTKFSDLITQTNKIKTRALDVKTRKNAEISSLKTQISTLQAQLDAQIEAQKEANKAKNPFESGDEDLDPEANRERGGSKLSSNLSLENEYAIIEIRGKNDKLIAKLLNKSGKTFLAQIGTYLQTGHIVEDITETYIKANKEGKKEYIYFAAGGILEKEPVSTEEAPQITNKSAPVAPPPQTTKPTRSFNVYSG